jgi:hypothetical protein
LRILAWIGGVLVVLVLALAITLAVLHEPRPEGASGAAAEALAHRIERAVDREAWERTGAVRFDFDGRQQHLWDLERDFSRVRWDDVEVLQRLDRRDGVALENGQRVGEERRAELVEEAWQYFCNDTFWLNPFVKLFDDGTERATVTLEGGHKALLLTYRSGGVTPGDSYLWIPGEGDLPTGGKMWVSIFPIGGVHATWDDWITLPTGAKVATRHTLGPLSIDLDVEAAATLAELEPGPDPFAALLE